MDVRPLQPSLTTRSDQTTHPDAERTQQPQPACRILRGRTRGQTTRPNRSQHSHSFCHFHRRRTWNCTSTREHSQIRSFQRRALPHQIPRCPSLQQNQGDQSKGNNSLDTRRPCRSLVSTPRTDTRRLANRPTNRPYRSRTGLCRPTLTTRKCDRVGSTEWHLQCHMELSRQ